MSKNTGKYPNRRKVGEAPVIGATFGRWIITSAPFYRQVGSRQLTYVHATCECGTNKAVSVYNLYKGKSLSCGCLNREVCAINRTTHGLSSTLLYHIWFSMLRRCQNPQDKKYPRYGGRGIQVAREWTDLNTFYSWAIGNGYKDGLSIDRIDNNGNYTPENCRWITKEDNSKFGNDWHRAHGTGKFRQKE